MRWPSYQHVFFDCDSTLSAIEGIDVLAERRGRKADIEALTDAAMNGDVDLADVYARRLEMVQPTRGDVNAIRQAYKRHVVADAAAIIAALQALGHTVYIVSGGLLEPVREFGIYLGVPRENIRAVGVEYNQLSGHWWQRSEDAPFAVEYMTYQAGPLTVSDGKAQIVRELINGSSGRALLIGDGTSDMHASRVLDLFVGYGGVIARPIIEAEAPVFLRTPSLAPLLALAAGPAMMATLHETAHEAVARQAESLILKGALTFNDEQLEQKFNRAYQAVYPRAG